MMMVMNFDAFTQSIQTIHNHSIYFITSKSIFPNHHCPVMKDHVYLGKIPSFEGGALNVDDHEF